MFRAGEPMTSDPRARVERLARELVCALSELGNPPALRVADAEGQVACLIQVWDASLLMPTAGAERRRRAKGGREGCKADIVEAVRAAGEALTRKEVIRALKLAGKSHGPGTVAKALADLTSAGELVNPMDKKGYRLAAWRKPNATPSLFD
jgi:hypothetical protein